MRRENSSLYETEKTKQVISISHDEPRGRTKIRKLERSVLNQRTLNQDIYDNWPDIQWPAVNDLYLNNQNLRKAFFELMSSSGVVAIKN